MGVGFGGLDIVRTGMDANQKGLDVTSHNISNLNTKGYVRQQAMLTSGQIANLGENMQIGLGAKVQEIRQMRNEFLDGVYRTESSGLGMWEGKTKVYDDLQAIFGEPLWNGLQDVMNEFWDSWQELAKTPESLAVRASVRQRGESLAQQVNHIGDQIAKLQNDLNSEIILRVNEINDLTEQIAEMNLEISKAEVTKEKANDFRDKRNLLIDKLCYLMNVKVDEDITGQVSISVGGDFLVHKAVSEKLEPYQSGDTGIFYVPSVKDSGRMLNVSGGYLEGIMQARGKVMGATGSIENGMPNTMSDITIAIDISDSSAGHLSKIKDSVSEYVDDLQKRGLDFELKLMTYATGASSITNYGDDVSSFVSAVRALNTATADDQNSFQDVVNQLTSDTYRDNANKYAVVFTNESINGNGGTAVTDATSWVNDLTDAGVKLSVVTDSSYHESGDASVSETVGWDSITDATSGNLYDINSFNFTDMITGINEDIGLNVNYEMSAVDMDTNVIPSVIKKINSLINSVMREVNYLHTKGRTYGSESNEGQPFFVPINTAYPLQMGNIKINQNLGDLDNIVSARSDETGDNTIALEISALRQKRILKEQHSLVDSDNYYQLFILTLGNKSAEATQVAENQKKLVNSADSYRQAVMNVSLDEEVSNMLKYKFAYSANARALQMFDQMLETIINGLSAR